MIEVFHYVRGNVAHHVVIDQLGRVWARTTNITHTIWHGFGVEYDINNLVFRLFDQAKAQSIREATWEYTRLEEGVMMHDYLQRHAWRFLDPIGQHRGKEVFSDIVFTWLEIKAPDLAQET